MTQTKQNQKQIQTLTRQAKTFYRDGWMVGTSGNLSVKLSGQPLQFAITASGIHKGKLRSSQVLKVQANKRILSSRNGKYTPSAETAIHRALYQLFPNCRAVFHVHTLHSTEVSLRYKGKRSIPVKGLEMFKGFGITNMKKTLQIPLFPNLNNLESLARRIQTKFKARQPNLPGFLIEGHGLTAWGKNLDEAQKHVELLEFICRYVWLSR